MLSFMVVGHSSVLATATFCPETPESHIPDEASPAEPEYNLFTTPQKIVSNMAKEAWREGWGIALLAREI